MLFFFCPAAGWFLYLSLSIHAEVLLMSGRVGIHNMDEDELDPEDDDFDEDWEDEDEE